MPTKIFGREPAVIVAAIQGLLVMALSFGWLEPIGLSTQGDIAVVVAVVTALSAVYLAYVTSETLLAPLIELFKAGAALLAIYQLTLTTEQTGAVIAFITVAFGLFQRTQTSPLQTPTFAQAA